MKKQSAAGLFFSMFLRAIVIILAVLIFVIGIALVSKAVSRSKDKSGETTVGDGILTEVEGRDDLLYNTTENQQDTSEDTTDYSDAEPSYDKRILVLNSTETAGLAGRWCDKLAEAGYTNTEKSDYTPQLTQTKVVSKTDGVGQDLVKFFDNATYEVGEITEGTLENTIYYDIVIIIGTADDVQ